LGKFAGYFSKFALLHSKFALPHSKFAVPGSKFAGCGRMWPVNSTSIAARPCAAITSIIIIT